MSFKYFGGVRLADGTRRFNQVFWSGASENIPVCSCRDSTRAVGVVVDYGSHFVDFFGRSVISCRSGYCLDLVVSTENSAIGQKRFRS